MKIGELARATRTPVATIRYYERAGLLPAAPRSEGNYRIYDASHVERLNFIRHCRAFDMALAEIRALLRFKDEPQQDCSGVNDLLDAHLGHITRRIRELHGLERQLEALRSQCTGNRPAEECRILRDLSGAAATTSAPSVREHVHGAHR